MTHIIRNAGSILSARLIGTALLGAGLMAAPVSAPAEAQTGASQGEAQTQAPAAATDVTETEIRQMAEATVSLNELNDATGDLLKKARDDAERARIRQQAQAQAVEAIRRTGLTVPRYNSIITAARQDEDLLQRIRDTLQTL